MPSFRLVAAAALLLVPTLGAQETERGAVFTGVVTDSLGRPVAGAEVMLPVLPATTRTDSLGAFRLDGIPGGTHVVTVRRVGYAPFESQIRFPTGAVVRQRIVLTPMTALEEIVVRDRFRDPRMLEFEENRRLGRGTFITRPDLERQEGRTLAAVLAGVPGLTLVRGHPSHRHVYAASSRARQSAHTVLPIGFDGEIPFRWRQHCYAVVYLDNLRLTRGQGDVVTDINQFPPAVVEAIEYYSSAAAAPGRYGTMESQCGVLVIHTRRSFDDRPAVSVGAAPAEVNRLTGVERPRDGGHRTLWANGGIGLGWDLGRVLAGSGSLQARHHVVSARVTVSEAEATADHRTRWDAGLLYGRTRFRDDDQLSLAIGVGMAGAAGDQRCLLCTGPAMRTTVGIPLELQYLKRRANTLGGGVYVFANVNRERSFGGVAMALQLRRMYQDGRARTPRRELSTAPAPASWLPR